MKRPKTMAAVPPMTRSLATNSAQVGLNGPSVFLRCAMGKTKAGRYHACRSAGCRPRASHAVPPCGHAEMAYSPPVFVDVSIAVGTLACADGPWEEPARSVWPLIEEVHLYFARPRCLMLGIVIERVEEERFVDLSCNCCRPVMNACVLAPLVAYVGSGMHSGGLGLSFWHLWAIRTIRK